MSSSFKPPRDQVQELVIWNLYTPHKNGLPFFSFVQFARMLLISALLIATIPLAFWISLLQANLMIFQVNSHFLLFPFLNP
jgi:hypothetical protein